MLASFLGKPPPYRHGLKQGLSLPERRFRNVIQWVMRPVAALLLASALSAALPLPQAITNVVLLSPTPPKTVDYNSPVEQGTILAQIDPTLFLTKVATARA